MHQGSSGGGDFTSSFYNNYAPPPPTSHHHQPPPPSSQFPIPNPNYLPDPTPSLLPASYASAPPFTPSDYPNYAPPSYNQQKQQPYQPVSDSLITAPTYQPPPPPVAANSYNQPPPPNPSFSLGTTPAQQPTAFPSFESHAPPFHSQQQQQQQFYAPFDQHQQQQGSVNYAPPRVPAPASSYPGPNAPSAGPANAQYPGSYNLGGYDHLYESGQVKFDQSGAGAAGGGYYDDGASKYGGGYGRSRSDLGSDYYGKRPDAGGYKRQNDDLYGDGVYAYQAKSKVEPYGARGTGSKSSTWTGAFDDYGRAISFPELGEKKSSVSSSPKIVKAVPKVETQQDVHSGVQKFRVKLLAESGGQSTMDVLCQIGLDGVRMLDPSTNRTLRIYPLETITRCDVTDSSTFAFWSKSSVDIEPRRIRLQSNRYTTNTILDIVTAATVQIKEMGGSSRPSEYTKINEQQPSDNKKGFTDWMKIINLANEEKDHWVPDEAVMKCTACGTDFGAFVRRHHCRNCGDIFCDNCTHGRIALTAEENAQPVRVCDRCLAEVTQRLSNAKDIASKKSAGLQSHEDLARKLQDEMERNRKCTSSSSKSEGSGRRMKEVACPTCTVHLQVQVPSSGSETIECGVCQHRFLVSSH